MNEFSNFVLTGEILPLDKRIESFLGIKGKSQYSHLPFNPDGHLYPLYYRTISLDGVHYSNPADAVYIKQNFPLYEFNYHNFNGFTEGIATNAYLK